MLAIDTATCKHTHICIHFPSTQRQLRLVDIFNGYISRPFSPTVKWNRSFLWRSAIHTFFNLFIWRLTRQRRKTYSDDDPHEFSTRSVSHQGYQFIQHLVKLWPAVMINIWQLIRWLLITWFGPHDSPFVNSYGKICSRWLRKGTTVLVYDTLFICINQPQSYRLFCMKIAANYVRRRHLEFISIWFGMDLAAVAYFITLLVNLMAAH